MNLSCFHHLYSIDIYIIDTERGMEGGRSMICFSLHWLVSLLPCAAITVAEVSLRETIECTRQSGKDAEEASSRQRRIIEYGAFGSFIRKADDC